MNSSLTAPDRVTTELRLIGSMNAATREDVSAALGDLDYPLARVHTGRALVGSYLDRAPDRAWAIFQGDQAVGVFAVVPYVDLVGTHQTSTYLTHAARGTGLNASLKRAVILASRAASFSLYSSIHHSNARSLAATRKLFVSIEPSLVFERAAQRVAWRFELSAPSAQLAAGPVSAGLAFVLADAMRKPSLQAA